MNILDDNVGATRQSKPKNNKIPDYKVTADILTSDVLLSLQIYNIDRGNVLAISNDINNVYDAFLSQEHSMGRSMVIFIIDYSITL
jgi:hypothetical protein